MSVAEIIAKVIPQTFEQAVWLAMGLMFGRAFGKKVDWDITNSEWFSKQSVYVRNILRRILDFTHHWWAGALLMLYTPAPFTELAYWFGAGLLIDDLPDVPTRLTTVLNSYTETPIKSTTTTETTVTPSVTVVSTPTTPEVTTIPAVPPVVVKVEG